jgi:Reverse transcriptase (RNA-dependent DNA polymerase)
MRFSRSNTPYVCHLQKAFYGLKQAPIAWFHKLRTFLLDHDFTCYKSDNSLFILTSSQTTIYLLIYVNDFIIIGNNLDVITTQITTLHSQFSIKDLGYLTLFSGDRDNTCRSWFVSHSN